MTHYNVKMTFVYPLSGEKVTEHVSVAASHPHYAKQEAEAKYSPDRCEVVGVTS